MIEIEGVVGGQSGQGILRRLRHREGFGGQILSVRPFRKVQDFPGQGNPLFGEGIVRQKPLLRQESLRVLLRQFPDFVIDGGKVRIHAAEPEFVTALFSPVAFLKITVLSGIQAGNFGNKSGEGISNGGDKHSGGYLPFQLLKGLFRFPEALRIFFPGFPDTDFPEFPEEIIAVFGNIPGDSGNKGRHASVFHAEDPGKAG